MHHANHDGYQFNYNGDYSGYILVTDPRGFEFPGMTLDTMIQIIKQVSNPSVEHVGPFRDFVADAIRREAVSIIETMNTDQVLASPFGQAALAD